MFYFLKIAINKLMLGVLEWLLSSWDHTLWTWFSLSWRRKVEIWSNFSNKLFL